MKKNIQKPINRYAFHVFNFVQVFITTTISVIYIIILFKFLIKDQVYKSCDTISCLSAENSYYEYTIFLVICIVSAVMILLRCVLHFYMYSVSNYCVDCYIRKDVWDDVWERFLCKRCCKKIKNDEEERRVYFGWCQMIWGMCISAGMLMIGMAPAVKDAVLISIHVFGVFLLVLPGFINSCFIVGVLEALKTLDLDLSTADKIKTEKKVCCFRVNKDKNDPKILYVQTCTDFKTANRILLYVMWVKLGFVFTCGLGFFVFKIIRVVGKASDDEFNIEWMNGVSIVLEFLMVMLIQFDYLVAIYFSYVRYHQLRKEILDGKKSEKTNGDNSVSDSDGVIDTSSNKKEVVFDGKEEVKTKNGDHSDSDSVSDSDSDSVSDSDGASSDEDSSSSNSSSSNSV